MKTHIALILSTGLLFGWTGCKTHSHSDNDHGHDHEHGHAHGQEVELGSVTIGDWKVELAQGRGNVEPGLEGHLVVKLPFNDSGSTTVRAWIGTEDRSLSAVGTGDYAPSHDDYDVYVMAPDPLPKNVMWWIEVETPDGSKQVGSIQPKLQ